MELSADLTRYVVWAAAIVVGALFAVLDRRWIGRPVLGGLLIAGVIGGIIMTNLSPFSFGGGGFYMEGVLIAAASTLALVGYVFAVGWLFVRQRLARRSRP